MIVKRKLYSVMDEEGNLGYYLYNESTGEEKMFSLGTNKAIKSLVGAGKSAYKPKHVKAAVNGVSGRFFGPPTTNVIPVHTGPSANLRKAEKLMKGLNKPAIPNKPLIIVQ